MSEYSRSVLVFFCVCVFFHFLSLCIPSLSLRLSLSLSRSLFLRVFILSVFRRRSSPTKPTQNKRGTPSSKKKTKKTQKFSQSAVVWIEMCRQRLDAFFFGSRVLFFGSLSFIRLVPCIGRAIDTKKRKKRRK